MPKNTDKANSPIPIPEIDQMSKDKTAFAKFCKKRYKNFTPVLDTHCPKCQTPVFITPFREVVYDCMMCKTGFVIQDRQLILLEKFLDPEDQYNLTDYSNFSKPFHKMLAEDRNLVQQESYRKYFGKLISKPEDFFKPHLPVHFEAYRKWVDHAKILMPMRNAEELLYATIQALHDWTNSPDYWINLAMFAVNLYLVELARKALTIAEKLNPTHRGLSIWNANLSTQRTRVKMMEQQNGNSQLLMVYSMMAIQNLRMENWHRAKLRFEQALLQNDSNVDVLASLANVYRMTDEPKKAIMILEELIQEHQQNFQHYFNLAAVYEDLGDLQKAYELLQKAEQVNPNEPRIKAYLAELKPKIGQ